MESALASSAIGNQTGATTSAIDADDTVRDDADDNVFGAYIDGRFYPIVEPTSSVFRWVRLLSMESGVRSADLARLCERFCHDFRPALVQHAAVLFAGIVQGMSGRATIRSSTDAIAVVVDSDDTFDADRCFPKRYGGVEVVVLFGEVHEAAVEVSLRALHQTVKPGSSISLDLPDVASGSLAILLEASASSDIVGVTSAHLVTAPGAVEPAPGVVQPGLIEFSDPCRPMNHRIGALTSQAPTYHLDRVVVVGGGGQTGHYHGAERCLVYRDIATFDVDPDCGRVFDNSVSYMGRTIQVTVPARTDPDPSGGVANRDVFMVGRSTAVRAGTVSGMAYLFKLHVHGGADRFAAHDEVAVDGLRGGLIAPPCSDGFMAPGDSGAAVLVGRPGRELASAEMAGSAWGYLALSNTRHGPPINHGIMQPIHCILAGLRKDIGPVTTMPAPSSAGWFSMGSFGRQ